MCSLTRTGLRRKKPTPGLFFRCRSTLDFSFASVTNGLGPPELRIVVSTVLCKAGAWALAGNCQWQAHNDNDTAKLSPSQNWSQILLSMLLSMNLSQSQYLLCCSAVGISYKGVRVADHPHGNSRRSDRRSIPIHECTNIWTIFDRSRSIIE